MRLSRKFTLAVAIAVSAVLAVYAWVSVRRETDLFESDMRRDQHVLGRALAAAVTAAWEAGGAARADALIADANVAEGTLAIRWVWLGGPPGDPAGPRVDRSKLGGLDRGAEVVVLEHDGAGGGALYTYMPARVPGPRHGALEVAESLADESRYVHSTQLRAAVTTVVMAGLCGLVTIVLGLYFVGQPMRRLTEKARRVGLGDLSGPLHLRQRDEIAELAGEMNAMCERLDEAKAHLASETSARIAALEQLRHAERLTTVGKLASGIAHELGTPLNIAAGRARMVESGEVRGDEARDNARMVVEQIDRMTKIIRQLLDFARRRGPQKASTDLRQLLQQTVGMTQALAAKKKVRLTLAVGEEPAGAAVDPAQLQQVLTNLIMNGIQAMPGGGVLTVGLVRTRAHPPADQEGAEASWYRVWVADEGVGIAPENVAHVFEPFFTTKGVGEGTGLGLSVAYGIVQEHGGWMDVESEPGRGSCFSVYLRDDAA